MNTLKNYDDKDVACDLQALTVADVRSVYSGRTGCCCGCNGDHRYNPEHVVEASKRRGYEVKPDEVNPTQVTKLLRLIQANEETAVVESSDFNHIAVEIENRTYVVYLTDAAAGRLKAAQA